MVSSIGHMLISYGPTVLTGTPVFGTPSMTARWVESFVAGTATDRYTITVKINGGNEVKMYIDSTN